MIEKALLPVDSVIPCRPALPFADVFSQVERFWEGDDAVEVIRHGEEDRPLPIAPLFAEFDRIADALPDVGIGQLVEASLAAVDRDEKCLLGGVDPMGDVVREFVPVDPSHGVGYERDKSFGEAERWRGLAEAASKREVR